MVSFPEVTFEMGYPDIEPGPYGNAWKETQQPLHSVTLSPYALDKTETTIEQYAEFLNTIEEAAPGTGSVHHHFLQPIYWENGHFQFPEEIANYPMNYVSFYDALTYCSWRGKTLPTEAQWEQAAKGNNADSPRSYPWAEGGPNCEKAIYYTNRTLCADRPQEVGIRPSGDTPEGISDLAGNVSEWTWNWFERYSEEPKVNPRGPATGSLKIVRGGGFRETSDALRTADRVMVNAFSRSEGIGIRCALLLEP